MQWTRCLIKVAADNLTLAKPATLAVRISSNSQPYFRQLSSTIERKNAEPGLGVPGGAPTPRVMRVM